MHLSWKNIFPFEVYPWTAWRSVDFWVFDSHVECLIISTKWKTRTLLFFSHLNTSCINYLLQISHKAYCNRYFPLAINTEIYTCLFAVHCPCKRWFLLLKWTCLLTLYKVRVFNDLSNIEIWNVFLHTVEFYHFLDELYQLKKR